MKPFKSLVHIIFICVLLGCGFLQVNAQTVCFSYDENGNRIHREICVLKLSEADSIDTISTIFQEKFYTTKSNNSLFEGIIVFPNPTDAEITIAFTDNSPLNCAELWIYSLSGQEILQNKICNKENKIDLSSFAPGTYILVIKSDDQMTHWKIIKDQG